MNFLKDQGFVLKTVSYSESDLIVYVLTKTEGVLHFFVRGARNSKKRFSGGVLQPPHLIDFQTNRVKLESVKEEQKLISLKEASLVNDFYDIRTSYKKLETLALLIKVVMSSENSYEALFNHFGGALKSLSSANSLRRFFSHFVVRHLYLEGVLPVRAELADFIKYPMSSHSKLTAVSKEVVNFEVALVSEALQEYLSRSEELRWPK